jgi:hypothetical protein
MVDLDFIDFSSDYSIILVYHVKFKGLSMKLGVIHNFSSEIIMIGIISLNSEIARICQVLLSLQILSPSSIA